jgi:hypothetical protein
VESPTDLGILQFIFECMKVFDAKIKEWKVTEFERRDYPHPRSQEA